MQELVAALLAVAVQMAHVQMPEQNPVVTLTTAADIQQKACNGTKKCAELHFYTDPFTGAILVNKSVDFGLTFAQAELFREVARYALAENDIYKKDNLCTRNAEIEAALRRMEYDFITMKLQSGTFVGAGMPTPHQLPQHYFACKEVKGDF